MHLQPTQSYYMYISCFSKSNHHKQHTTLQKDLMTLVQSLPRPHEHCVLDTTGEDQWPSRTRTVTACLETACHSDLTRDTQLSKA